MRNSAIILAIILTATACGDKNQYIEPPPPNVTVAQPLKKDVTEYLEFTGTTKAVAFVEIRARVSGFLQSMHFEPGTQVEKDDLLFIIDPKPYEAELTAAEAELAATKAEFNRAKTELARAEKLFRKNYLSETDRLKRQTERDTAAAAIGRSAAKVQSARLNLGYTRVTAPMSGRVGRNRVDNGNLVGEGEATLLATLTQYDPIHAYFYLNERDLLQVMAIRRKKARTHAQGSDSQPDSKLDIPVFLRLVNEKAYLHEGILDFGASGVDSETGTIELRGVFPNPGNRPVLIPGLFAQLRFPVGQHSGALLVGEQALSADQGGKFVLVVNAENIVEKRSVTPGQVIDGLQVMRTGIQADDRIVINGLQRARPGTKVNPKTTEMASLSTLQQVSKEKPKADTAQP